MAGGQLLSIEKINPGDTVQSSEGPNRVTRVYRGKEPRHYRLNGLEVTASHRFARPFARPEDLEPWTRVGDLNPGDYVQGLGTEHMIVEKQLVEYGVEVWNLEVEPVHDFYVSRAGRAYLVHNGGGSK